MSTSGATTTPCTTSSCYHRQSRQAASQILARYLLQYTGTTLREPCFAALGNSNSAEREHRKPPPYHVLVAARVSPFFSRVEQGHRFVLQEQQQIVPPPRSWVIWRRSRGSPPGPQHVREVNGVVRHSHLRCTKKLRVFPEGKGTNSTAVCFGR